MPDTILAPSEAQGEGAPALPAETPARPASAEPKKDEPKPAQKTFEEWATAKLKVVIDPKSGRASAVKNGRRVAKISAAALVNAVRRQVPIGKRMTEAEFDALLEQARSIPISIS